MHQFVPHARLGNRRPSRRQVFSGCLRKSTARRPRIELSRGRGSRAGSRAGADRRRGFGIKPVRAGTNKVSGKGSEPSFRPVSSNSRFRPQNVQVSGQSVECCETSASQEGPLPERGSSASRCAAARQLRALSSRFPRGSEGQLCRSALARKPSTTGSMSNWLHALLNK